jgi:hypothetical protein
VFNSSSQLATYSLDIFRLRVRLELKKHNMNNAHVCSSRNDEWRDVRAPSEGNEDEKSEDDGKKHQYYSYGVAVQCVGELHASAFAELRWWIEPERCRNSVEKRKEVAAKHLGPSSSQASPNSPSTSKPSLVCLLNSRLSLFYLLKMQTCYDPPHLFRRCTFFI